MSTNGLSLYNIGNSLDLEALTRAQNNSNHDDNSSDDDGEEENKQRNAEVSG